MLIGPRNHEFCLFIDRDPAPEMIRPGVRIVQVRNSKTVTVAAVAEGRRSIRDVMNLRRAVSREPLDVMYFPAVYSWFPAGGRTPTVINFHDAIAEHYSSLVFPDLRSRAFWTLKTWLARRSASGFTTVSNAARDEIAAYLGIPASRIDVILEAADPIFVPTSNPERLLEVRRQLGLDSDGRLLLYVGGLAPHKNLIRLAQAFAEAIATPGLDDLFLVFVGDPEGDGFHSNYLELRTLVESDVRLAGRVRFTGFVSDDDLVCLYNTAYLVAMPALSEGFGLPAAEAIACGTPVIATRDGAVAEVVGKAGLFFDPLDIEDMTRTLVRAASDAALYDMLRRACVPRSAELSWPVAASETLDILERHGRSG